MIRTARLAAASLCVLALGNAPASVVKLPGYSATLTLSPRAATTLARRNETIIVSAMYFGEANARGRRHAGADGELAWGRNQQVELNRAGTARFRAQTVRKSTLALFIGAKPQVLINAYSGRRSGPDNLLACDIFQNSVYVAARTGIRIHCKLIAEA